MVFTLRRVDFDRKNSLLGKKFFAVRLVRHQDTTAAVASPSLEDSRAGWMGL